MRKLVSFFEIPATDFGRAVTFYQAILGCELSVMDCEVEKMAFFPEESGGCPGAISFAENFKPSTDGNGVLIHFNVKDLRETIGRIEANGGEVVIPITKIEAEGRGYFAVFRDSEGNKAGLYADE